MSLDSRLRLARKNGTGANLKHFEVPTMVEALELLRACERAEAKGPLPAPPFPAFIARDLVEAELQAMLETCRERITDLGGDCDPVDRMLEGAMHMLDMRVQGKARDQANPVDPRAAAVRSSDLVALLDNPVIAAAVRVPGEEVNRDLQRLTKGLRFADSPRAESEMPADVAQALHWGWRVDAVFIDPVESVDYSTVTVAPPEGRSYVMNCDRKTAIAAQHFMESAAAAHGDEA